MPSFPFRRRAGLVLLALISLPVVAAAQSTLLSAQGDFHGDQFGTVLAFSLDIDGDGRIDNIVGCPEDDSIGEDAGAVFVVSGIDGTILRKHYGSAAGDRFGASLAGVGDVDGDGVGEYAVGAPFADGNGTDSGQVRVFSGADGHLLSTLNGLAPGDRFGSALVDAGLFIDIGVPDNGLVIGAPYADGPGGTDSGAVYFRDPYGNALLEPPTQSLGIQANEHYGAAIDAAEERLIIGAPDFDGGPGANAGRFEAWVFYEQNSMVTKYFEKLWTVVGTSAGARVGSVVSIVHWPNANGVLIGVQFAGGAPDAAVPFVTIQTDNQGSPSELVKLTGSGRFGSSIAASSPGYDASYTVIGAPDLSIGGVAKGRVSFYRSGSLHHTVDGTEAGERFGAALEGQLGGPSYGNQADQFLIGAPNATGAVADAGRVEQHTVHLFNHGVSAPAGVGERLGSAVAGVGDLNGDGVPDLLVGSPDDDASVAFPIPGERINCGSAKLLSGATGAVLRTHLGGADGDHLGASVAALGDINLDGVPDYVIGAPQNDNTSTTAGYAVVVSGATGSTLFTLSGFFNSGEFGAAVGGGSDVNGDGRLDILVGSPGTSNGNVTAYSGLNGASLGTVNGATAGDRFGAAVAGLGADLNGDGKQEYLVGAPGFDFLGSADAGRAYLMRSTTSLLTINVNNGFAAGDQAGSSVAPAGDVNKDGVVDYIVGIPGYDSPATDAGRVRVISGSGALGTQLAGINGNGLNDRFGTSVTSLGDVNHDTWPDWAGGAREADLFVGGNGYVKVISGKDQAQLFQINGSAGEGLGVAIADAGDVNGDGTRDLIAGAPFNGDHGAHSGVVRVYSLSSGGPVWTDLGFALAGTAGLPSLVGTGSLVAGTPGALTLSSAKPASLAYLFIALSNVPTPFKGGTLVPIPPLFTLVLPTSGAGDLLLPWAAWPAGLSGLDLFFQYAIQDAAGPQGASLSNAVRADIP